MKRDGDGRDVQLMDRARQVLDGAGLACAGACAPAGRRLASSRPNSFVKIAPKAATPIEPPTCLNSVHLHPAVVLLAVTAGASLFGIAGAFLAVPVAAVVAAVHASLSAEESVSRTAPS